MTHGQRRTAAKRDRETSSCRGEGEGEGEEQMKGGPGRWAGVLAIGMGMDLVDLVVPWCSNAQEERNPKRASARAVGRGGARRTWVEEEKKNWWAKSEVSRRSIEM